MAFTVDANTDEKFELYLVPSDGSAAPVKISGPLTAEGDVLWFQFNPAGGGLAYYADQAVDERYELYDVTLPGSGAPVKLNGLLVTGGDVVDFSFSPDGAYVVYVADQETDERYSVYAVLLPGGAPVRLNQPTGPDEQIYGFDFGPDSSFLLYGVYGAMGDEVTLYRARPDGSGEPAAVITPPTAGSIANWLISPAGDRIIYTFGQNESGVYELYSVSSDNSGAIVKLNGPLVAGGSIQRFDISPDGRRVVYQADQDADEVEELYLSLIHISEPTRPY